MRLALPGGRDLWLAYGMNVHPGGTVDALERAIASTVEPLRDRLGVEGPMGVALRLDGEGAFELLQDEDRRTLLRRLLEGLDLVPFTGNAFVVGDFHGRAPKAEVYRPTWAEADRVRYTLAFAEVIASLVPAGTEVSLSTAPGSFKPFVEGPAFPAAAAARIAEAARGLVRIEETTGVPVRLGLEPEPLCTIETTAEAVAFFQGPLRAAFGDDERARSRVGVCYDVCHQAVEGEDPEASLAALARAGVPLVKVQASCALVLPDPSDEAGRAALAGFDEPRWLHQVAAGAPGASLRLAADLPEVLAGPGSAAWAAAGTPWRVHFHVPVHRPRVVPPLVTTQPVLERALRALARAGACSHLEIETYTWEGLPAPEREGGLVESLAREYEWVLGVLASEGARRTDEGEAP